MLVTSSRPFDSRNALYFGASLEARTTMLVIPHLIEKGRPPWNPVNTT
jgi:hypothetical protein